MALSDDVSVGEHDVRTLVVTQRPTQAWANRLMSDPTTYEETVS